MARHGAPGRGVTVLAVLVALVFLVSFAGGSAVGGGWFWDLGNALGFLALAGLLFQSIPGPRGRDVRRHEVLGYWVLAVALLHAFWFLAGDGAVRVHLQPGAPLAMWLGLLALVLLAALTVLARMPDRMRVHRRFRTFRNVHRVLGVAVVGGAALHVMLTGFYVARWGQDLLLVLLVAATCFGRAAWARLGDPPAASGAAYAALGLAAVAAFLLARSPSW